ncbi:cTPxI [Mucor velutinosus]|uniref:CTPxI n=1 Tax=Mucor velutinosus TaxID=708070 RepID=A0AAN7I1J0_9FUNG|nr:cTPxI [Mucor velutinosus]
MSKSSIQVDSTQSDSDLSLQLSDASSLSSDSDLSEAKSRRNNKKTVKKTKAKPRKKKKAAKKDAQKYCICRKGYDGKEFMIECEDCKEWFHGACVGLKPNSVSDHYACSSCTSKRKPVSAGKTLIPPPTAAATNRKKSVIVLPVATKPPPTPPQPIPVISTLSIQDDDEDEDLDDICVLCDGDCTCNIQEAAPPTTSTVTLAPSPPSPPHPAPQKQPQQPPAKLQTKIIIPVPKKSSKAISKKKSRKSNKWTVHNTTTSNSHADDSDDDSNISISDSDESESDDEPVVVERVGIDTKKSHKSKAPKKKMLPKKSTPRRGKSKTVLANIVRQKAPPTKKGKGKKMAVKYPSSNEEDNVDGDQEDSDEELIVDDLDDLLETMSPLSEHSSNESDNSLLGSEEFFTDDDDSDVDPTESDINAESSITMSPYATSYASSIHLDSGDDEDIENVETQKIINELTLDSDEEMDDMDSDILDEDGGMFVEDEYDDEDQEDEEDMQAYYARNNSHWSSSSEEEEEEEFDYTTAVPSEDDVASIDSADDDKTNPLLPLLDSEGNLYDSIAAAFMQALIPMGGDSNTHGGDTTTGANTPVMTDDYQLSAFELTNALSALSAETSRQHNDILLRRPSLPSSAVSAARRMRGSQDFSTSEALRALSALVSDDLPLALQPIDEVEDISEETHPSKGPPTPKTVTEETTSPDMLPAQLALSLSTDLKLQEQILDILQGGSKTITEAAAGNREKDKEGDAADNNQEKVPITSNTPTNNPNNASTTAKPIYTSRQILPKPSGSGSYFPAMSTSTSSLEQQIQEAWIQSLTYGNNNSSNKRKATHGLENDKKRRPSRSNSLGSSAHQQHLQPLETTSFSTPASPAAIIDELEDMNIQIDDDGGEQDDANEEGTAVSMDDLVDTSQLYTRSSSRSPSPEIEDAYSRDLSRWQRIPIGAFRLMRSKNKLWLER